VVAAVVDGPDVVLAPVVVPLVVVPLVVGPEPLVEVPAPPAPPEPLGRFPPPSSDPTAQEKSVIPAANNNANNETDKEFFTLMVEGSLAAGKAQPLSSAFEWPRAPSPMKKNEARTGSVGRGGILKLRANAFADAERPTLDRVTFETGSPFEHRRYMQSVEQPSCAHCRNGTSVSTPFGY
jgi:hypothetical protein